MQDGVLYSNILLKLYLKSLKHGGRLQLDEDIPYTAQMIATTPVPVIVIPPKTGDMTIWQSILHFLGIR